MTYPQDIFRAAAMVGFDDEHDTEIEQLREELRRKDRAIGDAIHALERGDGDDARRILQEGIRPKKERGGQ